MNLTTLKDSYFCYGDQGWGKGRMSHLTNLINVRGPWLKRGPWDRPRITFFFSKNDSDT